MTDFRSAFSAGFVVDDEYTLKDGSIVRLYRITGLDFMQSGDAELVAYESFLKQLDYGFRYEFHLVRSNDASLCDEYDEVTENNLVREKELTSFFRTIQSQHHRNYGKSNTTYFSIITGTNKNIFDPSALKKQTDKLDAFAIKLSSLIKLDRCSTKEILQLNLYFLNHKKQEIANTYDNPYNSITETLVHDVPILSKDKLCMESNGSYFKAMVLQLYPDAYAGILDHICFLNSKIHIKLSIKAIGNSYISKNRQATQSSKHDTEVDDLKNDESAGFRKYVAQNHCALFKNNISFVLESKDKEQLIEDCQTIGNFLTGRGAIINDDCRLQHNLYVHSLIGESYLKYDRVDHSKLMMALLPINATKNNYQRADILRLSSRGNLFALNYEKTEPNHGFTIGASKGGKDAEKVLQIAETYGLGYDYFVTEIDPSYKFIIELLGGNYIDVDPNEQVINPFPKFGHKMRSETISIIVSSIAPLLKNSGELDPNEMFVAEVALEQLYKNKQFEESCSSEHPNFDTFRNSLDALREKDITKEQAKSLDALLSNMSSFIDSPVGSIFKKDTNIILSPNICGINLKRVTESKNKSLSVFYLNFIAMQFKFLAEQSDNNSLIVLNELHEFSAIAPEVTNDLIRRLTRMGRRKNVSLEIVTQNVADLDLDEGILNNMPRRKFVYMREGHDAVKNKFPKISNNFLTQWKGLNDPKTLKGYRQQLVNIGDDSELLTIMMPKELLSVADTNLEGLREKERILKLDISALEKVHELKKSIF
jgi:hypothetical protein